MTGASTSFGDEPLICKILKKWVHHQKMYLTFKDKHDSNVAQRDVWYKKEKCCFDFLYHNRLSLSSTLCGEEPKKCILLLWKKVCGWV
ncbi:hypothetical protein [Geobacillus stearothermophilus]